MMTVYTSGTWKPYPGSEETFVEAWTQFASWAGSMPGAGKLRLTRDLREPAQFVSFGDWDSLEQVKDWKTSPEFRERMAQVLQHVDDFKPAELTLVATADAGSSRGGVMNVHYKKDGIATVDVAPEKLFKYMSAGDHPHAALKSHRLVGVSDGRVTLDAEVYNPDGSTFEMRIEHRLDPPNGIETTMIGGHFDGARFVHTYTPIGDQTKVDLEGDFPVPPGLSEAEVLAMIDGFFTMTFDEDTTTLRTWSPAE